MGSRLGWRWGDGQEEDDSVWDDDDCDDYVEFCARAGRGQCCEINWLDPEPSRLSNDYDIYINDIMDQLKQIGTADTISLQPKKNTLTYATSYYPIDATVSIGKLEDGRGIYDLL